MSSDTSSKRYCGSVKWYNYKLLYGFITYQNDDGDFDDIFVYIKDIVSNKKNKYLNKGEYVEFNIIPCENYNEGEEDAPSESSDNKVKAGDVTGINRGMLQHEYMQNPYIIALNKSSKFKSKKDDVAEEEEGEWKTVSKKR